MQQMNSSIVQVAQSLTQSMEIMGRAIMQQNISNAVPSQNIGHMIGPTNINYGVRQVPNSEPVYDENVAENWTYHPL